MEEFTLWIRKEGQVKTPKEPKRHGGTHSLSSIQEGSTQDTKRNQVYKGHLLAVKHIRRVNSEH
jgi:hypothetical protein